WTRQLARTHCRVELRQSRLADGRWLGGRSAGPATGPPVGHARSAFLAVLHRGRGRAAGGREALASAEARHLAPNLSARLRSIPRRLAEGRSEFLLFGKGAPEIGTPHSGAPSGCFYRHGYWTKVQYSGLQLYDR